MNDLNGIQYMITYKEGDKMPDHECEMRLISPKDYIDQINDLWEGKPEPITKMKLYKDCDPVDISKYIKEFIGLKDKDKKIEQTSDLPNFLKGINNVYHTRVYNIDGIANGLKEKGICSQESFRQRIKSSEWPLPEFVELCKSVTGQYTYSFASKVYSFLLPKDYPIIDSISSTLLSKYLSKDDYKIKWGTFSTYKDDYDFFLKQYGLGEDYKYKKADIFLWTYGKILLNYWLDNGAMVYEGVSYNPNKQ